MIQHAADVAAPIVDDADLERLSAEASLSMGEVAMAVGISEWQLARAFAEYGMSLRSYLRSRRIHMPQTIMLDPRFVAVAVA